MGQSIKFDNDTYIDWSGITIDDSGTRLSTALGTYYELAYANASVPTSSILTILQQKDLPAGIYIATAWFQFVMNNNGTYRNCSIRRNSDTDLVAATQVPVCQNATTRVTCTAIVELTKPGRIYCTAEQNSGGNLTIQYAHLRIVRIK